MTDYYFSKARRNSALDLENKFLQERLKNEKVRSGLEGIPVYEIKEIKKEGDITILLTWESQEKTFEIPIGYLKDDYAGYTAYATNFDTYMKESEYPSKEKVEKDYERYKVLGFKQFGFIEDEYNSEWKNNLLTFEEYLEESQNNFMYLLRDYKRDYFHFLLEEKVIPIPGTHKESLIKAFVQHFFKWARLNRKNYEGFELNVPEDLDLFRFQVKGLE